MSAEICLLMDMNNQRLTLSSRPVGPPAAAHFTLHSSPARSPATGEVLLATHYLSIDPAMRVWMDEDPGYVPPIALGQTMRGAGIGKVLESSSPQLTAGDLVQGQLGWQSHPTLKADDLQKLDLSLGDAQAWMGPLGSTGLTAYFGLLRVARIAAGETVLVSAASGAVGQMVGQIARAHGARSIGIAGGPEKCRLAREEHGFDEVVDYKLDDLARSLPQGIDVFFDNVGGTILDTALTKLAARGRVVICGRISQTGASELYGVKNLGLLIGRRARVEGFIVSDYAAEFDRARSWLAERVKAGEIKQRLHILHGLEQCPEGLAMLFRGANTGKLIVAL